MICPVVRMAYQSLPTVTDYPFDGFVKVPVSLGDSTKRHRPLPTHAANIEALNCGRLPASGMRSPLPLACQAGGTPRRFGRFVANSVGEGPFNTLGHGNYIPASTPFFRKAKISIGGALFWWGWALQNYRAVFYAYRVRPTTLSLIRKTASDFTRFTPAPRVSVRALARGN